MPPRDRQDPEARYLVPRSLPARSCGLSERSNFPRSLAASHVVAACAYCARPNHVRRTLKIALVVGVILTLINQSGVIFAGHATTVTWVRCGLNFLVPFLVSNLGLLAGRRPPPG